MIRYEGGILLEIFDIDRNGYFRGQFEYYENEISMGQGRPATERNVRQSINFFYGKLKFSWFQMFKKPNPLLWNTNRIYHGEVSIIDRLDWLTSNENDMLEAVYTIAHHRESKVIEFTKKEIVKETFQGPGNFPVMMKSAHLLDWYSNVKQTMRDRIMNREL